MTLKCKENNSEVFQKYAAKLSKIISTRTWDDVEELSQSIFDVWKGKKQMFLCGNGGSAGNSVHLANDFLYGIVGKARHGIKVEALAANQAVLTCLANDISYDEIFSKQLVLKAEPGDLLIVLSGSGESMNIVRALEVGNELGLKTVGILGYTGGQCKNLAQLAIHFPVDDMQISEDLQLVVGHMCMQWLRKKIEETYTNY